MRRRDWLLLAIANQLEPIQVQKTLFKFAMESDAPGEERYSFEPYNWGPCSFDIYPDLERLRDEGLIDFEPSGRGWNVYRTTPSGSDRLRELREQADPAVLKQMDGAREFVVRRSFGRLLHDTYEKYPEYATRSLFRR